jgi:hypothetical protein
MAVLGVGVGLVMQNLVLAAQNDVPARELGAATSVVSFFRSMGGTIGVSALGAVLANRVATSLGMDGSSGGGGAVPDLKTLSPEVKVAVQEAYGNATADLFVISVPIAVLALVAILFIKEKSLLTTTAAERRAAEEGADKLDA